MARICSGCNKFASISEGATVDVEDSRIEEDTVTVEVRVPLESVCCGEVMAESRMTWEREVTEEDHKCEAPLDPDQERYSVDDANATFTTEVQTTDRNGKPIRNPRYQRTYYGAAIEVTVRCNACGDTFTVTGDITEQASSFESY